ncbi:hypothetical protein Pla110_17410 [Polystyrenella longa]|uniref:Uncharacterized protein n=1 Tax=Polystyrenella longa TaxID=2528007 RepID=A0A518CLC0_9PLAN|nr:hypothetical protein [Polystyrenella longa]QDU80019.1 hypothetical protein Pla110_17410 [Polystyrenella longa]
MTTSSTTYERQSSSNNPQTTRTTTGELQPVDDVLEYVKTYAIHNPGTTAAWCFGIGFIVGWKLKPW